MRSGVFDLTAAMLLLILATPLAAGTGGDVEYGDTTGAPPKSRCQDDTESDTHSVSGTVGGETENGEQTSVMQPELDPGGDDDSAPPNNDDPCKPDNVELGGPGVGADCPFLPPGELGLPVEQDVEQNQEMLQSLALGSFLDCLQNGLNQETLAPLSGAGPVQAQAIQTANAAGIHFETLDGRPLTALCSIENDADIQSVMLTLEGASQMAKIGKLVGVPLGGLVHVTLGYRTRTGGRVDVTIEIETTPGADLQVLNETLRIAILDAGFSVGVHGEYFAVTRPGTSMQRVGLRSEDEGLTHSALALELFNVFNAPVCPI